MGGGVGLGGLVGGMVGQRVLGGGVHGGFDVGLIVVGARVIGTRVGGRVGGWVPHTRYMQCRTQAFFALREERLRQRRFKTQVFRQGKTTGEGAIVVGGRDGGGVAM